MTEVVDDGERGVSTPRAGSEKTPGIERAIAAAGSEAALGEMLGVTQQAVNRMKKRGYVPLDRLDQIANAFGIDKRELINPKLQRVLER